MRVWMDTEFNGFHGELISLSLVSEDGREWYEVLPCVKPTGWVATKVIPVLNKRPTTTTKLLRSLQIWMSKFDSLHVIASWPADFVHFLDLLMPYPGARLITPPITMELTDGLVVASAVPHNALEDARALRKAYLAYSAA